MNTEHEHAAFKAWLQTHCDCDDLNNSEIELAHDAWQARAALQPATLRPVEEAPKDGTVILAWCVHEADPYYDGETGRLTAYGANAEGMAHVDDGWNLVHWQESFFDGECHIPAWWTLADGYGETAANPVLWVPLPTSPKPEDKV